MKFVLSCTVAFFSLLLISCEKPSPEWNLHTSRSGLLRFQDLKPSEQMALYKRYFSFEEEMRRTSERYLIEEYYQAKAKEEGVSVEEYRGRFSGAQDVSDEKLLEFYEQNKERIPYPFEQIKEELKQHLQVDAKLQLHDSMMAEARTMLQYQTHLGWMPTPQFEIPATGFPKKGSGKIQIVEFADFLCPHCQRAFEYLETVDPSRYQLTFIPNFPKSRIESQRLAVLSLCAKDKFWEVYPMFFQGQNAREAEALALLGQTYASCEADMDVQRLLTQGVDLAETYGVTGTPTFFVNGRYLARGLDDLKNLLAK